MGNKIRGFFNFWNSTYFLASRRPSWKSGGRQSTISCPLCNSLALQDFFVKFAWAMYQGTHVCCVKESCRCDLWPVTLKPKFPSALCLLNEWRFFVDIWCEDVSWDKGLSPNFIFLAIGTRCSHYLCINRLRAHQSFKSCNYLNFNKIAGTYQILAHTPSNMKVLMRK
jgi:hypothetical protein